jgi:hypothetical protein
MTRVLDAASGTATPAKQRSNLGWALRRALLAIVILAVCVSGAAWLMHNSIDPVQEAQAADGEPAMRKITQTVPSGVPPRMH